jgi:hypothetical protein
MSATVNRVVFDQAMSRVATRYDKRAANYLAFINPRLAAR